MKKRLLDILLVVVAGVFLFIPILCVAILVRITSSGPILYWSDRVGRDNRIFKMPKFRSMQTNTPVVATHLLTDPNRYLTPIGGFLRKSSLDELPQLWCVLTGEMSLVGPRPALYNQHDLIQMRTDAGIEKIRPGVTGWAQVNGRDELPIPQKVEFDEFYLREHNLFLDIKVLWMTVIKVVRREGVTH